MKYILLIAFCFCLTAAAGFKVDIDVPEIILCAPEEIDDYITTATVEVNAPFQPQGLIETGTSADEALFDLEMMLGENKLEFKRKSEQLWTASSELPLQEGTNIITVTIEDSTGTKKEKLTRTVYLIPNNHVLTGEHGTAEVNDFLAWHIAAKVKIDSTAGISILTELPIQDQTGENYIILKPENTGDYQLRAGDDQLNLKVKLNQAEICLRDEYQFPIGHIFQVPTNASRSYTDLYVKVEGNILQELSSSSISYYKFKVVAPGTSQVRIYGKRWQPEPIEAEEKLLNTVVIIGKEE